MITKGTKKFEIAKKKVLDMYYLRHVPIAHALALVCGNDIKLAVEIKEYIKNNL